MPSADSGLLQSVPHQHPNDRRMQFRTFPLLSIMGIVIGYLIADLLIPDAYFVQGALFAPSLALSIGLVSGVVLAGLSYPGSALRAESIMSFGLIYWVTLDPMQGSYGLWGTSLAAVHNAFLGTAIFAASMWIGGSISHARLRSRTPTMGWEPTPLLIFQIGVIVFLGAIFKPMLACSFNPVCLGEGFFYRGRPSPGRPISFQTRALVSTRC